VDRFFERDTRQVLVKNSQDFSGAVDAHLVELCG
jgi:hypothetical protein